MTNQNHRPNKGFSLLEMTVVLGIVAFITAMFFLNLPPLKGGMSIDVVAQEVAIYIRGAQVYSRATKVEVGGTPNNYNSYGIHFNRLSGSFFLWADNNNSVRNENQAVFYWENNTDLIQETYSLPSGFTISKLVCVTIPENLPPIVVTKSNLDIVFQTPDPEAQFANTGDSLFINGKCNNATFIKICLKSANLTLYRVIETHSNGHILVRTPVSDECK